MHRSTWVVMAVTLAASTAHADRHWRARVSFDDTMKHEGGSGGEKVTTTREAHASFELQLTTTDDEVTGAAWGWSTVDKVFGASGSMKEEMIVVNDGHTNIIRFEGNIDPTQLGLECEYNQVIWRCRTGVTFKGNDSYISDGKLVKTVPQQKAEPALFQKNGKGASVSKGGERFTFANDYQSKDSHQRVTIAIDPLDKTGVEAVFVMDPGYEAFIPEGQSPTKAARHGNSLDLHIELRDAKTHKKSDKVFAATLALDSSRLRGSCMNFPAYGESVPDEPDLYFAGQKDEQKLELAMGKGSGKVTVSSRDYGGYAKLTAHIKLADGTELDVRDEAGNAVVDIPKDDNHNHIADFWELSEGVKGNPKPDVDDESLPQGMASPGDGYTLFEEYRGFVVADPKGPVVISKSSKPTPLFARLHPNVRDVFVGLRLDTAADEAAVRKGLDQFAQVSLFDVSYVADAKYLAPGVSDYSRDYPRRVDLRSDSPAELYGKPQTAIWITDEVQGYAPASAWTIHGNVDNRVNKGDPQPKSGAFRSPREVSMVVVSRAASEGTVSGMICYLDPDCVLDPKYPDNAGPIDRQKQWNAGLHGKMTADQRRAKVKQAQPIAKKTADAMITFTVMHELGHALGAYHHGRVLEGEDKGDQMCPMLYWHTGEDWTAMIDFLVGAWDLTKAHNGQPWHWCGENRAQLRLRDED